MSESTRQRDIRARLELEPDLELFVNRMGAVRKRGHLIQFGLRSKRHPTGSNDLVGILGPDGRWFMLETKTPGGKTSKDRAAKQAAARATVRGHGGFAAIVHDADEAMQALERARKGERR